MYSKDDVRKLLETADDEEILSTHSRATLSQMYDVVFGLYGAPSGWRKQDILRAIRRYFAGIERAQRLKP